MKRRLLSLSLLSGLTLLSASACLRPSEERDYGDPTERNVATEEGGIVAWVVSPTAATSISSASVEFEIAAYAKAGGDALTVRVGTGDAGKVDAAASGKPGPEARFRATVPLVHGANVVQISAENADGSKFRRLSYVVLYEGQPPGLAFHLLAPGPDGTCKDAKELIGGVTAAPAVCARGVVTAAEGRTIGSLALAPDKGAQVAAKPAEDGSFEVIVPITKGATTVVTGTVTDSGNRSTSAKRSVLSDPDPPNLVVTAPAPGKTTFTDAPSVTVEGTVEDAHGVASLRIDSAGGYSQSVPVASPFKATVTLVPGKNDLTVVARDNAGNEKSVPLAILQNRIIHLSAPKANQGATQLSLDKTALSSLIQEPDQKTLIMAEVPLRPAIVSTLKAIRDPEKFGVDTTTWAAPEQNMNRLLNMTPDTSNLKGSSVEELLGIATAVGLPPPRLLGDLLGIQVTTTFVDLETAADVILAQLVGTHPNATKDAKGMPVLRISMYDVFQDLHTVGPRFGPSGDHPGFLDGATESKCLQPGFHMSLPVKSNLKQYEGVDASAGERTALFLLDGSQVLELDFTSSAFSIAGLTDEPTIDLRMKMTENPAFLKVGTDKAAGADPDKPGFYRGSSGVWQIPPWQLERVVAEIAYRQNAQLYAPSYAKTLAYDAGSIKNAATIQWDKGWVTIKTAGGIGSPPAPQYAWDLLTEVAQIRLHDGGVAEGKADLGFSLNKLPIGLTADDLIAKVKPSLQSQSAQLSKLIAGTGGLADSGCDLFYVPKTAGGGGFLFFRAAGDSQKAYAYPTPGFFGDAGLTQKLSTAAAAPGTTDSTHEKIDAKVGTKVFFQDDGKQIYTLEIVAAGADGVDVRVIPAGAK